MNHPRQFPTRPTSLISHGQQLQKRATACLSETCARAMCRFPLKNQKREAPSATARLPPTTYLPRATNPQSAIASPHPFPLPRALPSGKPFPNPQPSARQELTQIYMQRFPPKNGKGKRQTKASARQPTFRFPLSALAQPRPTGARSLHPYCPASKPKELNYGKDRGRHSD
jgi:hypothetical protein